MDSTLLGLDVSFHSEYKPIIHGRIRWPVPPPEVPSVSPPASLLKQSKSTSESEGAAKDESSKADAAESTPTDAVEDSHLTSKVTGIWDESLAPVELPEWVTDATVYRFRVPKLVDYRLLPKDAILGDLMRPLTVVAASPGSLRPRVPASPEVGFLAVPSDALKQTNFDILPHINELFKYYMPTRNGVHLCSKYLYKWDPRILPVSGTARFGLRPRGRGIGSSSYRNPRAPPSSYAYRAAQQQIVNVTAMQQQHWLARMAAPGVVSPSLQRPIRSMDIYNRQQSNMPRTARQPYWGQTGPYSSARDIHSPQRGPPTLQRPGVISPFAPAAYQPPYYPRGPRAPVPPVASPICPQYPIRPGPIQGQGFASPRTTNATIHAGTVVRPSGLPFSPAKRPRFNNQGHR
eukprot:Filipodium_phascolosomae@DN1105_c0_g1_i2.p1